MANNNESKYLGPQGFEQAVKDMKAFQDDLAGHLVKKGSGERLEQVYGIPPDQINLGGLSRELVNTASDPTDVQMIEKLHRLVHEVQFSGNASNFIQGDTLRLLSTISRETGAFLLGIRYQQQAV